MRVLALDTTTRAGSVALVEDDRIIVERSGDPARTHAERLPGEIVNLLDAAGVALSALDLFAVAAGPGSFTGLRIGIATMQGLAFVNRRRIVAPSALEALAQEGSHGLGPGAVVAAWMDAHRRDVFSALYRLTAAPAFERDPLIEIDPPAAGDPASTLLRWTRRFDAPAIFIGDGAVLYASAIGGRGRVMAPPALAATIGMMAIARARAGDTVDPAGAHPLYVRRPDAELARDATKEKPHRT